MEDKNAIAEKEYPHDLTVARLEEAVLSALLLKNGRMAWASAQLKPEMFLSPRLGFIYRAMLSLFERGVQPDWVTTVSEMRRIDPAETERLGELRALAGPTSLRIRHDGNLEAYVGELRRNYLLRCLAGLFNRMEGKSRDASSEGEEVMAETEKELIRLREELRTGTPSLSMAEMAAGSIAFHKARMEKNDDGETVCTGLTEFDTLTGGMHPGELFVGAGRPGDGKSAVALHIAIAAAQAGKHICLFSLEMSPRQIIDRYFVGYGNVEAAHLRKELPTQKELERMQQLQGEWEKLDYYFNYSPSVKVETIRAEAILQHKKGKCSLVIVDYLNMLDSRPARNETLEQVIAANIRALKALAMEIECPVLVLAQMNRSIETRTNRMHVPMMSDLRDSGTIEQVADCVFFVYNPARHGLTKDARTGEDLEGVGKLIVVKNRNGMTGTARFRYNRTYTRLCPMEQELGL